MEISVNWLRALAPSITGTAAQLADELSMRAVPVDSLEEIGAGLDDLVVGRVLSAVKHPDADRLTLCRVDAGTADPVDVVCGAPDVVEGALYPYIPPGGMLPGGFRIESRKIRGQMSHGMLCSEKEIGLGRDAAGILRLANDLRPGQPLDEALGLPDARLGIDLTPNRIDLACHVGVARELAPGGHADIALSSFGSSWEPTWEYGKETAGAGGVRITIEDPGRCFRYLAAIVRGVEVGPSPAWLQARLRAAGARPINNVVDATNYVLLELNQPLHAFDLSCLEGPEIRVRGAADELLVTLDGREHRLGPDSTVIADARRPVALAGVMGGEESEVSPTTTDLLIECAAFDPASTRRTARAAGLSTDASYRFERGIDERGLEGALRRCVELILATAGGAAEETGIGVGRPRPELGEVRLRRARVRQLLGLRLSEEQIAGLLAPLGFETSGARPEPDETTPQTLRISVPGWRVDVRGEVDLLEEIARRYGYESFPHEPRAFRPSAVPDSEKCRRADRVRSVLAGLGLLEARSASFVSRARAGARPVPLLKPLSADERYLRTDLVPVLLGRLEHNLARGRREVRLFEVGTVFEDRRDFTTRRAADRAEDVESPAGPAPAGAAAHGLVEEMRVGLLLSGRRAPVHWSTPAEELDVWDLKGTLERIGIELGIGEVRPGAPPDLEGAEPSVGTDGWLGEDSFCIFKGEELVGAGGRVRPGAIDAPPWAGPVWAAEFRLSAVELDRAAEYRPLPAFPAVSRDLAIVVPVDVPAAELTGAIREAAPPTLEALALFDEYEGEGIEEGRRSLAWHLAFRAEDRTLTDDEVERNMSAIMHQLEARFDARVRSS